LAKIDISENESALIVNHVSYCEFEMRKNLKVKSVIVHNKQFAAASSWEK